MRLAGWVRAAQDEPRPALRSCPAAGSTSPKHLNSAWQTLREPSGPLARTLAGPFARRAPSAHGPVGTHPHRHRVQLPGFAARPGLTVSVPSSQGHPASPRGPGAGGREALEAPGRASRQPAEHPGGFVDGHCAVGRHGDREAGN